MKISLSWLKEFVDLDIDANEVAQRLTLAGVEVSSVHALTEIPASVVVARIITRSQHPNADRLSLCKVEDGTTTFDIVCGATNMKAGDKVAMARVGSKLPGNFEIKRSKIRGENSEGMLCSSRELNLGSDSDGIMILDPQAPLGQPLIELLNLNDAVLEIEITPNRGDCLSIIGVARELAALGCGKLKLSENKLLLENEFSQSIFAALEKHDVQLTKQAPWSVKIHDTDRCSRYMALRLDLATMPATPAEIVRRLEAAGQRSINLIVDITNYVLLEWGQPLHAFDVDKLSGQEIHVRVGQSGGGKPGEKILALDEKEYLLTNNDLLICDAKQPHCIAGVMGGKHSAVTTETRHLLLESASFASATVRTTAKRLGLSSESSYRFERGVDPEITPYGLAKAAALIMKLVPGVTIHQIIDQRPKEFIANRATYRSSRFARLMGYSQDLKQAQKHLTDLGAKILEASGDTLHLLTPSWRPDLVHEIDLIEEVARLSGYEQIPIHLPSSQPDAQLERHADRQLAQLQGYLTGQGFHEVKNLAFIAPDQLGEIPAIKLTNPLASDLGVMRPTLLPGLLKNFRHNYDHYKQHKAIRLFEIGTIFQPQTSETNGASKDDSRQPNWGKETLSLALIAWQGEMPSWQGKLPATDFFWIKAIVENLLKMLTDSKVIFSDKSDYLLPFLHPTVKSDLLLENKIIGSLGRVHPERLPDDCQAPVVVFEFNLGRFLSGRSKQLAYHAYSSFPVVERDLAILVGDEIASASLLQIIQKSAKPLLHDVQLIDRYVGEKLPAGKKSLAFRLWFQAPDRTLKDEEVESLIQQSLSKLTQEFGATLRS